MLALACSLFAELQHLQIRQDLMGATVITHFIECIIDHIFGQKNYRKKFIYKELGEFTLYTVTSAFEY